MASPASTCTTRSTDRPATSRPGLVNTIDGAHPSQAGNDLIAGLLAKLDIVGDRQVGLGRGCGTLSRHAARGIPSQARLREDPGTGPGRADRRDRAVRRPAPPGHPPPLRLPARDRGRPRVVGRPQGPDPRLVDPPDGRPRRGPPDRVLRLRGGHPGQAVRRGRRHRLGLGHVDARGADPRRRARPSPTASSSSSSTARSSRAASRSSGPAAGSARATTPPRAPSRTTRASSGCSSTSAAPDRSRAGTPRTTRRASRPAAPTTTSRPTATRSGSAQAPAAAAEIDLTGAVAAPMPQRIEPMLATLATKPFSDPDWLFEIKWDGYRVQAVVDRQDGPAVDPQPQRRRDLLPAPADAADLDRGPRGDRRRRGRRARRRRAARLRAPPGAARRQVGAGARVPGVRPALPRWSVAARRRARGPQAPAQERPAAAPARPLRGPRRRGGARLLRGRQGPGPRGHARQAPPLALRTRSPVRVLAEDQDPAGAGAGRRWLDAGRGAGQGPRRGRGRRLRGRPAAVQRQGRLRVRRADAPAASSIGSADLEADDPPFDPPPPRDYRGRWGGELRDVHWVRPELVIRAELGGWSRDGMVRQAAFKGIEEGRDPLTVAREVAVDHGDARSARPRRPARETDGRRSPTSATAARPTLGP